MLLLFSMVVRLAFCLQADLVPSLCIYARTAPTSWHTFSHSVYFLFIFKNKFIYLFLAALGLCCCARAFASCGERGLLFVAGGLLIAVASRCGARALGMQASVVVVRGLSSHGLRALEQRLSSCGTWA